MHKGFTLIETLLVIAIISSLSAFGMMKIFAFQKDAKIDATTNEILSTLKFARNKSELGEIPYLMSLSDFLPDKLPSYGVRSTDSGYGVNIQYETPTGVVNESVGSDIAVPDDMSVNIPSGIFFERLTGKTSSSRIDILYKGSISKCIIISSSGYFTVRESDLCI
jgi:prepilin-type N-terminal cleavage/methylation domain-containing protein